VNRREHNRIFADWVRSHNAILWKVARSFAPSGQPEDLHQELLVALWQAVPAFRGQAKPSTFVYRVAHNFALTWLRKQQRYQRTFDQFSETVPDPAAPLATGAAELERRIGRLYEGIRGLPEIDRTLTLLYLDEVSYREMADVLGISESNVGVRLHRIKKRLAEELKED
jgi:RNA polymerase sigma-70 factor (ECF subfamily)